MPTRWIHPNWMYEFRCNEQVWEQAHQQHSSNTAYVIHEFADCCREETPSSEPGDWVWLSTGDLHIMEECRKPAHRYNSPFKILKRINKVTYKLNLPRHSHLAPFLFCLMYETSNTRPPLRTHPHHPTCTPWHWRGTSIHGAKNPRLMPERGNSSAMAHWMGGRRTWRKKQNSGPWCARPYVMSRVPCTPPVPPRSLDQLQRYTPVHYYSHTVFKDSLPPVNCKVSSLCLYQSIPSLAIVIVVLVFGSCFAFHVFFCSLVHFMLVAYHLTFACFLTMLLSYVLDHPVSIIKLYIYNI